jgi:sulfur-oxidizing protein SoxY
MMSGSSVPLVDFKSADDPCVSARRRALLLCGGTLLGASLLPIVRLGAAEEAGLPGVKPAFGAGSLAEVLRLLDAKPIPSDDISLDVPDFVENGAVVPVEIQSRLPEVQDIYIISESNPFPLVARFTVPDGTEAFVSTRIKVASSCNIHVLVRSNGQFFSAVKATAVTVGGCGA